jgi:hypothetical protein
MEYRVTVLASPSSVPPPPRHDALKFRGISIMAYVAHETDRSDVARAVQSGKIAPVAGHESYADKVKQEARLFYSEPLSSGAVTGRLPNAVGVGEIPLFQSAMWLGGDQLISGKRR